MKKEACNAIIGFCPLICRDTEVVALTTASSQILLLSCGWRVQALVGTLISTLSLFDPTIPSEGNRGTGGIPGKETV